MRLLVVRRFAVVALTLAAFASAARAGDAAEGALLPGQRGFGELDPGGRVGVLVRGVEGTQLTVRVKRWKGDDLRPAIAVNTPGGARVNVLESDTTSNATGSIVSVTVTFTETGPYEFLVTGADGTSGGFDLTTAGTRTLKFATTAALVDGAAPDVTFPGLQGDLAQASVSPSAAFRMTDYVDADGVVTARTPKASAAVRLLGDGTHALRVAAEPGAPAEVRSRVKIKPAKGSKKWLDLVAFAVRGSISGTLQVDGAPAAGGSAAAAAAPAAKATPPVPGQFVVSIPGGGSAEDALRLARDAAPDMRWRWLDEITRRGPHLLEARELAGRRGDRRQEGRTRSFGRFAKAAAHGGALEPNGTVAHTADPNDTLWGNQPDMRTLRMQQAWDITTGGGVNVAVIDTGTWSHPDLDGRYIGGWDFVRDASVSADGDGLDGNPLDAAHIFHGTHCSGTIGATTNNKLGVAGAVWNARVVPVRVFGTTGFADNFDIAKAVMWSSGINVSGAIQNPDPCRVISMSLGGAGQDTAMRDACAAAIANGTVIVAAAGNNNTSVIQFPAGYPGVIAVAALAPDGRRSSFSSFGSWISVCAPGGDQSRGLSGILSTYVDASTLQPVYTELQGTSMACPHVAGVAALMVSLDSTLTPAKVKQVLEQSSTDLGPVGFDQDFGFGLVNAEAALNTVKPPPVEVPKLVVAPASLEFGADVPSLTIAVRNTGSGVIGLNSVTTEVAGPISWLSAKASFVTTPSTITVTANASLLLGNGTWEGAVRIVTSAGTVLVPVRLVRAPPQTPGPITVQVYNSGGILVKTAITDIDRGWKYHIDDVPVGSYVVRALGDRDGDFVAARIDEYQGLWPSESVMGEVDVTRKARDVTGIDVPVRRRDSLFRYHGVGSIPIDGALAVRVFDAGTGRPVVGARLALGNGVYRALTDADGRALLSGTFHGPQILTVAADGYSTFTRIGCSAEFQTFTLRRETATLTAAATVTVRGLTAAETLVRVQVGNDAISAAHDGSPTHAVTVTTPRRAEPTTVWVTAFNSSGTMTRVAIGSLSSTESADTVAITLDAAPPAAGLGFVAPLFVGFPTTEFSAATAQTDAAVSAAWTPLDEIVIGQQHFATPQQGRIDWASFGVEDPLLSATLSVTSADASGRRSTFRRSATLDQIGFLGNVDLTAPIPLYLPDAGAVTIPSATVLVFGSNSAANTTLLTIEDLTAPHTWEVMIPGRDMAFTLPTLGSDGLIPAHSYRWRAAVYVAPDASYHERTDEEFRARTTHFATTAWRTFSVQ